MQYPMLAAVLAALAASAVSATPLDVFGEWRTDDGDHSPTIKAATVTIRPPRR